MCIRDRPSPPVPPKAVVEPPSVPSIKRRAVPSLNFAAVRAHDDGPRMRRESESMSPDALAVVLTEDIDRIAEERPVMIRQVQSVFRMYDKDEDGRLNHEELQMALADLGGATMTPTSQQEALRRLDKDLTGDVDLEEFTDWWFSDFAQV
eukprot:TRINITY_DN3544_c0_g1_i1.p1 TRINITY_DN3544_c0_g1~~TRINITY_DN3544_c0_g1_i1.p1  ORF type:complete len:150 (+),score=34.50 TRINITY_DN3544_c0_g1_i1:79-528(+)